MREKRPIKGAQRLRMTGAAIGSKNAPHRKEQMDLPTAASFAGETDSNP